MKRLWVCALMLGLCVACGDDDDVSTEPTGSTEVSLTADVMPLIQQRCGGCHTRTDAPFPNATVNGTFYESKEDVLGMVGTFIVAGDSSSSGFVAILTQELAVGQGPTMMPPPDLSPEMPASEVAVITSWINEGANDN